ncbi:MAG: PAS-domain containing protein, partial [Pseudomonadota bacterium]
MIIVAGVALSTMLASDVLLPLLSRGRGRHIFRHALFVRRISLVILLALAAIFALAVPRAANLADLGVVAFAGAGQVAPLFLAALYVPRVNEKAAIFGLLAGVLGWIFFVLGPAFFVGTLIDGSPLSEMLAFPLSDAFTRGTVLALAFNVLAIAIVSFSQPFTLEARQEAARFGTVDPGIVLDGVVRFGDLRALLVQILGPREASSLMSEWADNPDTHFAPPDLIAAAEAKLSGVLGNASAHILMTQLLASGKLAAGDVMVLMGHASRSLRFSQELLATTLENLAEGVSVIDGQGRLVAWNRAYADLFQYPPNLLQVGVHVEDLLRHNLPSLSDQGVQKRVAFLAAGHAHTSETTLNDGRILRLQGRPVPGGGYVTSFSDVTEYRNSQKALVDSEKATRFYTENIPFPIAFCDNQQAIRFHNKAYAKMAGRSDMDLTGALLTDLHGHLFQLRQPHVDAVLSGSGQQRFVLTPGDIGGSITWQVTYVPQLAVDGTVLGFFGFYQDISKRRQAQAALEEANRTLEERVKLRTEELQSANHSAQLARREAEDANQSKTRFLAAASHDVLQPLNAARLFASSLEDSLSADSDEAATAKKIGMAIVSADTLLRSLLNLSKLEAGGVDPKFADLELGPFLRSIVEEFRPMAMEKGLDLKLVETSVAIRTDAGL